MKRKILLIILLMILAGTAAVLTTKGKPNRVCYKNHCFNVALAKTGAEISRGLMFVKNLSPDKGMLFIFEKESEYPFWMKNTLIPLDIIWINENKKIVFINENAQPCKEGHACLSINPRKNAGYVLEVNGGVAEKIGLKVGDKISLSGFLVK